jgi:hypothetical protein
MRAEGIVGLVIAISFALGGVATSRAQGRGTETCGTPFRIPQKSFKRLDAPNAYVWVDDIESGMGRGYTPFQIAVVVGSAYPPFRAEQGRLERQGLDSLVKSGYGITRTNGTVSEAALKTGVAVSFTAARKPFVLRVVSVHPSTMGDDAVTLKLCR